LFFPPPPPSPSPPLQGFHVGGLLSSGEAGVGAGEASLIAGSDLLSASPDLLCAEAESIVDDFNSGRSDEVALLGAAAAGVSSSGVLGASLLWVDAAGAVVEVATLDDRAGEDGEGGGVAARCHRLPFDLRCVDARDCRSKLTMMAQVAWEKERNYTPEVPASMAGSAGGE